MAPPLLASVLLAASSMRLGVGIQMTSNVSAPLTVGGGGFQNSPSARQEHVVVPKALAGSSTDEVLTVDEVTDLSNVGDEYNGPHEVMLNRMQAGGIAESIEEAYTFRQQEARRRRAHRLTLGALSVLMVCSTVTVLLSQGLAPFLAVLSYIVSLVIVKLCVRELLKAEFPFPYATTAFHMLVTGVVASYIEMPTVSGAKSCLCISVVKAASLALNNAALFHGSATFVSILGACTPATTYAVELCRCGSATTAETLSILAACSGAMLCVKGEYSYSLPATVLTLGACVCRSLKTVWSYQLLHDEMSPFRLSAWTGIWSFAIMVPATLIKEGSEPLSAFPSTSLYTKVVFFVGAGLAAALNVLMCFVLKSLGPLQQNIFSQLELVAVLTLAMAWFHEQVTGMQWMGIVLIFLGCAMSARGSRPVAKQHLSARTGKCAEEPKTGHGEARFAGQEGMD